MDGGQMALDAQRRRGRRLGLPRPCRRGTARDGRRAALLAWACAGVLLAVVVVPAAAQQTLIIGGGPPVIGRGAGGVVVNNEVLESLGPAGPAPALAYPSLGAVPAAPGVVYRQPDTGQLLVTRPSTLLFPPPRYPRSRLTAQAPVRGPAQAPQTGAAEPELTSRLLVPPAPKAAPSAPSQVAETPAPVPKMASAPVEPVAEKPVAAAEPPPPPPQVQPAPKPEAAEPAPEPQISTQPAPAPAAPTTSAATAEPPPPSTLIQELTQQPAAQKATAEPEPPSPALSPEPPAPAQPPAAAPPPVETSAPSAVEAEPPPPPAKSLTAEPAVEAQTAALPPTSALAEQVRILFQAGSAELSDDAKGRLTSLAEILKANASVRVHLLAHAKGTAESASRARRLSLSRALSVRAFLIEQGVRSTRMDVRALGDKAGDGPMDRVDILPQPASQ